MQPVHRISFVSYVVRRLKKKRFTLLIPHTHAPMAQASVNVVVLLAQGERIKTFIQGTTILREGTHFGHCYLEYDSRYLTGSTLKIYYVRTDAARNALVQDKKCIIMSRADANDAFLNRFKRYSSQPLQPTIVAAAAAGGAPVVDVDFDLVELQNAPAPEDGDRSAGVDDDDDDDDDDDEDEDEDDDDDDGDGDLVTRFCARSLVVIKGCVQRDSQFIRHLTANRSLISLILRTGTCLLGSFAFLYRDRLRVLLSPRVAIVRTGRAGATAAASAAEAALVPPARRYRFSSSKFVICGAHCDTSGRVITFCDCPGTSLSVAQSMAKNEQSFNEMVERALRCAGTDQECVHQLSVRHATQNGGRVHEIATGAVQFNFLGKLT